MRETFEYFCSGCGLLRSKNEEHLSGDCPRCGTRQAKLINVKWKDSWKTYWDLEAAYGLRDSKIEVHPSLLKEYNRIRKEGFTGTITNFVNQAAINYLEKGVA